MNIHNLATLEKAIEPYRAAGYTITNQSESAMTLIAPQRRFSWIIFIFCLLFLWPVAVIYLIVHNRHQRKSICVRVTSTGDVEITGYTFEVATKERQRMLLITVIFLLVIIVLSIFIYLRIQNQTNPINSSHPKQAFIK